MAQNRLWFIFTFCLCFAPLVALGNDFDGSKSLSGTVNKIMEINYVKITDNVDPDTVGLPRKFLIDFEEKSIRPSKDSLVRKTARIRHIEHIENKLILQGTDEGVEGADDGLAWSITISKKTGAAVLTASGDGVAYVVFGTCIPAEQNRK